MSDDGEEAQLHVIRMVDQINGVIAGETTATACTALTIAVAAMVSIPYRSTAVPPDTAATPGPWFGFHQRKGNRPKIERMPTITSTAMMIISPLPRKPSSGLTFIQYLMTSAMRMRTAAATRKYMRAK